METQKKTYLLPQKLIDEMKKTFQTKTETEALIQAMKEIALQNTLVKWHLRNSGRLKVKNLYGR